MLNITVICVGKLKERFYTDAANEYIKRLSGYCKLEVVEIAEHSAQIESALDKERAAIEKKVPNGAYITALCVEGNEFDSPGLAELLTDCAGRGASRLCIIIGGSNGLHGDIKKGADIKLSLSKMTFPHNLARVILLEQLYRAFKIIEGGKYHK
jgi:23S rRNA (pseudouridine1915-N3)-methyltransferase